ncbi:MAG: hypothetical protein N4A64_06205, partial [Marinisporobacter sp.]|nr:hypothetical protein [Marinisporobacter sp.]
MNFIPFIAIPIAILLIIFVAYSGFTTGKKCENDIYETMKKNNNKVTNVKEIPMFSSEEIPFSRMNSSGFKRGHNIYR